MKKIWIGLGVILVVGVIFRFTPLYGVLWEESHTPAHLFDIENSKEVYVLIENSDSRAYGIYPLINKYTYNVDSQHAAYISSSPQNLDLYIGKKVKITGKFVLTNHVLKSPTNTKQTYQTNSSEAVEIDSISLAQ